MLNTYGAAKLILLSDNAYGAQLREWAFGVVTAPPQASVEPQERCLTSAHFDFMKRHDLDMFLMQDLLRMTAPEGHSVKINRIKKLREVKNLTLRECKEVIETAEKEGLL